MTLTRILCLLVLTAIAASPVWAEPVQRGVCTPIPGRGYRGGCPTMENKAAIVDIPEAAFGDPSLACQRAQALATEQLKARARATDRARGNTTSYCLDLTIRCVPCGQVQK